MKNRYSINNNQGTLRNKEGKVFTLASVVAVMVFPIIFLFASCNKTYRGPSQISAPVTYSENGVSYQVEATPGEVIVVFNDNYSHREEKKIIKSCGGKIIAQTVKAHYYVVAVAKGNEDAYIQMMREQCSDIFVFPNAVFEPCMAKPVILDNNHYVIEKYSATHGELVDYAIKNVEDDMSVDVFDVGVPNDNKISLGLVEEHLIPIIKKASKKTSPVINMSFGPGFSYGYKGRWINAPDSVRVAYRNNYINGLKGLINIVKPFNANDFIIVKSIGNEGVKNFDKEILQPLLDSLKPDEKEILNKHFLLVSAKDDNSITYSNEMEKDSYHPLVSTTDITDMEFNQKLMHGTSYSSPLAAGYISSIMNKYDIGAVEALAYAKQATQSNPQHLLVFSELEVIVKDALSETESNTEKDYVDLGLPSGTLWKSSYEDGLYDYNDATETFGNSLPTRQDIRELLTECNWTITMNGYEVTGPNGKSIFFPFGLGMYDCEGSYYAGEDNGNIWSSTSEDYFFAWTLSYNSDVYSLLDEGKCCKYAVRLVSK